MKFKMSPAEYYKQIRKLYDLANKATYYNPNVTRGRSHSVAGPVEDLSAYFLAINNPNQSSYFVDQAISADGKQFYPDIMVVEEDNTVHTLIDVKVNIGWNRDGMLDLAKKHQESADRLRGRQIKFNDKERGERVSATVADEMKYLIVLVTTANGGAKALAQAEQIRAECPDVDIFFLSTGKGHPAHNHLSIDEHIASLGIDEDEFDRLLQAVEV